TLPCRSRLGARGLALRIRLPRLHTAHRALRLVGQGNDHHLHGNGLSGAVDYNRDAAGLLGGEAPCASRTTAADLRYLSDLPELHLSNPGYYALRGERRSSD